MFHDYRSLMQGKFSLLKSDTLTRVTSISAVLGTGFQTFATGSNLVKNWSGNGQQSQGTQATGLIGQGQQVVSAIGQLQQSVNGGAQILMAAQKELMTQTKAALAEGFRVSPTGLVELGPAHWKAINALRAAERFEAAETLMESLEGKAKGYMAGFDLVVFQVNAAEAQTALTLVNTAASILGTLTQKEQKPLTTPTTTTTPPTTGPPTTSTPVTTAGTTLPPLVPGSGLAGAGSFGVAGGTGLGLNGVDPSRLGGLTGVAPGSVAPGAAGGAFAGGAGMGPGMMFGGAPMAGGHMGGDREHRDGNDWLDEDEEYDVAEAANEAGGVLS